MCEVVGVTFIFHCEQNVFVFFVFFMAVCVCYVREVGCALKSQRFCPPLLLFLLHLNQPVIDWSQF